MSGDDELVRRAREHDKDAFEQLVKKYMRHVYAVCYAVVKNHFDADDAAQNTFIRAYRKLDDFKGKSLFKTWLIAIAINQARDILRANKRREVSFPFVDPQDPGRDHLSTLIARQEEKEIQSILALLPEKQRLSVILRINQGIAFKEIGEILGISENAARTNYHYGFLRIVDKVKKNQVVKKGKIDEM